MRLQGTWRFPALSFRGLTGGLLSADQPEQRSSHILPASQTNAAPKRSLRFHLRAQTAAAHEKLDAAVGDFESVQSYARYCRGILRFRAPVEAALQDAIPNGIDGWQPVSLIDALKSDLRDLGLPDQDDDAADYRLDFDHALGALYVLEGSSLGARILIQRAAALGFSERHGAKHLALQTGDRTNWPRFVDILERHGENNTDAVIRGANDAFAFALQRFPRSGDDA